MNVNRLSALTRFLLALMFGLQVVTLISGTYLYLDNIDLRKSNEDILTLLTDLKNEMKSSDFEQNSLFEKQTGSVEEKHLFSEDLAILNEKFTDLSKLIEDQQSDTRNAIDEDSRYEQAEVNTSPKESFSNEYSDSVDSDLISIKDEISNQFLPGEMDGVLFNSIECRAKSCRVDLDLSSSDLIATVQDTLAINIGRDYSFDIDLDENGSFTMYFSVD